MFLLYHAYIYLEFLILACTIYILAPVQKLPDIAALKKEMDSLTAEKQQEYGTYQKIKVQVKELDTIKRNVDQFLSAPQKEEREKNKERG